MDATRGVAQGGCGSTSRRVPIWADVGHGDAAPGGRDACLVAYTHTNAGLGSSRK
jgi:hypothetical protein